MWCGKAYPLGATYDGFGTKFAQFTEVAERVELCLFDSDDASQAKPSQALNASTAARTGQSLLTRALRRIRWFIGDYHQNPNDAGRVNASSGVTPSL